MKKLTFISILAALFLGLFSSCEQNVQKQIYLLWESEYDLENRPFQKFIKEGYKLTEEDLPELTDKYYTFKGWKINGEKAYVGQKITTTTILHASWEETIFNIKFETNFGTAPESKKLQSNHKFIFSNYSDLNLENKGYNFLGWSLEKDGEPVVYSFFVDKDITLYAVWEPIKKELDYFWDLEYSSFKPQLSYQDKKDIEKITLQLEPYTGTYSNSWQFDGSINPYTVYINGTEIIISANAQDDNEEIVLGKNCNALFSSFTNVKEIVLPEKIDTSEVTNMSNMFSSCENLETLDLSNFDTSNVTNMSGMFSDCKNLKTLDLSNFDTSNVTDMDMMFYWCENLETLDLSNFDTSKVTNMRSMFNRCKSLTEIDFGENFNTSNVISMWAMFEQCDGLTSLDLSKFDTSNVINMNSMFHQCWNLKTLDISSFDTSKVTDMSFIFSECYCLEPLNLGDKFNTSKVTDMSYMFSSCQKFDVLDVSKFDTSNVTNMMYMFAGCDGLETLDISNFDTSKVTDMQDMFKNLSKVTTLKLGNFNTSNVTNMHDMFYNCRKIPSFDLSQFDTSKVVDMSYMFGYCQSVEILDISTFETSNLIDIDNMFNNCNNLKCIFASDKFTIKKVTENYKNILETEKEERGLNVFTADNKLKAYDTDPERNQHDHGFYTEQNQYQYAQIYKTRTEESFEEIGYFTDVAIKDEVLAYLATLQQGE